MIIYFKNDFFSNLILSGREKRDVTDKKYEGFPRMADRMI